MTGGRSIRWPGRGCGSSPGSTRIEHAYGDLRKRVVVIEERSTPRPAPAADLRRTTNDGRPDTRGSTAASRFAHRLARSADGV